MKQVKIQVKSRKARNKLHIQLEHLLNQSRFKIKMLTQKCQETSQNINFDYHTINQFEKDHKEITKESNVGNESWINFTVKLFDYVAKDPIQKKNDMVIYRLVNSCVPPLFHDEQLFDKVVKKINDLKNQCYSMAN